MTILALFIPIDSGGHDKGSSNPNVGEFHDRENPRSLREDPFLLLGTIDVILVGI